MNTTYKSRTPVSLQVARKPVYTYRKETPKDTVQEEINKLLGTYQFSATFEVDTQTASTLQHIPGLIAFLCTIKKGDQVIGQGRGTTVINQVNRFIVRTINFAFNAALIDAIVRSTKILDIFRPDAVPHPWAGTEPKVDDIESDSATPKQIEYLRQLIQINIDEDDARESMTAQLGELTRSEASKMIESFRR